MTPIFECDGLRLTSDEGTLRMELLSAPIPVVQHLTRSAARALLGVAMGRQRFGAVRQAMAERSGEALRLSWSHGAVNLVTHHSAAECQRLTCALSAWLRGDA